MLIQLNNSVYEIGEIVSYSLYAYRIIIKILKQDIFYYIIFSLLRYLFYLVLMNCIHTFVLMKYLHHMQYSPTRLCK